MESKLHWKNWRTGFMLFLAVAGPGIITANVDNDAGGILTYSQAGAGYGYSLLWTMIPTTIALIVVQEMCARMGAVTGKGLSDLIREEYGLRITFVMLFALVICNFGNVVCEFAGVAESLQLFHVSKYISVPIVAVFVWAMVVKGSYKSVEKIFLVASLFYITYIIAGVMAHPDWKMTMVRLVTTPPRSDFTDNKFLKEYIYVVIGVVGTTIAPWMQFYLQSSIVEKGVTPKQYGASRLDVIVGSIFTDVVAVFIIIACAATLYLNGVRDIQSAADAALALRPLAGDWAFLLFALGLLNASVFAASILPLSTSYTVCEGLGFESGVDKKFSEAPVFYWLYTALIAAGALVVLIPNFPLIKVILFSQVLNGILLPFILIFMLLLINKTYLMGEYVNTRLFNFIAWTTVIVMNILTVILVYSALRPKQ
jgi:NRAMP (natural resistance-associated macrophage protein)-like metal ion transporter